MSSRPAPGIWSFTLGPFATNCYVVTARVRPEPGDPCWIVDASFDPDELIGFIQRHHLVPQRLILTHAHVDHIAGVDAVRRAFPGLPVLIHPAESSWLQDPLANLSGLGGMDVATAQPADGPLDPGQLLTLPGGDHTLFAEVLHTPGHSPGGISLSLRLADAPSPSPPSGPPAAVLCGDALFAGSIGRTDFPGSDASVLIASVRDRLYPLGDDVRVFPGHGPATTIGVQRRTNPFVRG
ncbi:MAG: MBL fold metallo-hydrolase [bacterium]